MIYLYADEKSTTFVELETVPDTKFFSRSHNAVIRVYDEAGSVIETHEQAGEFKSGEFFTPSESR
jgi:hypothetical protein